MRPPFRQAVHRGAPAGVRGPASAQEGGDEEAFVAEEEKIAKYHEARSLPVKVKTKGRFSPAEIARKQALEREASAQFLKRESSGDGLPQVLEDGEAEGEGEAPEAPAPEAAAEAGGEAAEPKKGRKTVVSQAQAVDTAARDNEKSILDEVDLKMRADLEKRRSPFCKSSARSGSRRFPHAAGTGGAREPAHEGRIPCPDQGEGVAAGRDQGSGAAGYPHPARPGRMSARPASASARRDKERLQRLRENNVAAVERRRMERLEAGS
ncbi:unnamed protein product [Prorocentrum cordatum]|uniref:Uncharacterized protein n=1 Tax=Prorocentrum cordatum TaxID=2364126 RepID=A0ABN9R161_9DINO|nr:unnamed protein product [Polarella glacialis]